MNTIYIHSIVTIWLTFFNGTNVFAENARKEKSIMQYGISFGEIGVKPGDIFNFKDFSLKFEGYQELTPQQKKLREESIAKGIEGGNSMLVPSNRFMIFQGTKNISEIELMILPHHVFRFEIDSKKFELRNDPSKKKNWIVDIVK